MEYLYCGLIGYMIGTFNPAYLIARIKGFDIRKKGSGNAGATNALILLGKLTGAVCALLDIAKCYLAILLCENLFPNFPHAFAVTGAACIIGHIYPFYMRLKGGKGLACLGGMILYYDWRVFLAMLIIEAVIAFATNYLCFVPITASIAFPIVYAVINKDIAGALILATASVPIVLKHVENVKRIRNGTEAHMSFLWKPKAELERIHSNTNVDIRSFEQHFSGEKSAE